MGIKPSYEHLWGNIRRKPKQTNSYNGMLLSKLQIKQVTDYQSRPLPPIIGGCQCHLICYRRHQWHRPSTSHFRWYGRRGRRPLY